jgi:hypothetical protein
LSFAGGRGHVRVPAEGTGFTLSSISVLKISRRLLPGLFSGARPNQVDGIQCLWISFQLQIQSLQKCMRRKVLDDQS